MKLNNIMSQVSMDTNPEVNSFMAICYVIYDWYVLVLWTEQQNMNCVHWTGMGDEATF